MRGFNQAANKSEGRIPVTLSRESRHQEQEGHRLQWQDIGNLTI